MGESPRGFRLFSKIETREQAQKVINEVAYGLYMLAALQFILSYLFLHSEPILGDVIFMLLMGFSLQRSRSRSVAIVITIYAVFIFAVTLAQKIGVYHGSGGTNFVLAAIFAYTAYRGGVATFVYHRHMNSRSNMKHIVILSVLASVLTIVVFFVTIFVGVAVGYDLHRDDDTNALAAILIVAIPATWLVVFNRLLPFTRRFPVLMPSPIAG